MTIENGRPCPVCGVLHPEGPTTRLLRLHPESVPESPATVARRIRWRQRGGIQAGLLCINCRAEARNDVIVHGLNCPEFGRTSGSTNVGKIKPTATVAPIARAAATEAASRYARFTGMLTQRRSGRYDCPSCTAKGDGHGLKVDLIGTRITIHCFACGGYDEILSAMRCDPSWLTGEER